MLIVTEVPLSSAMCQGQKSRFQSLVLWGWEGLEVQTGICPWSPVSSVVGQQRGSSPTPQPESGSLEKKKKNYNKIIITVFPAVRRGWTGFPQEFLCVLIPTSISFMQLQKAPPLRLRWTKWEQVCLCSWPKVETLETIKLSKNLLLRCILALLHGCTYLLFPDVKKHASNSQPDLLNRMYLNVLGQIPLAATVLGLLPAPGGVTDPVVQQEVTRAERWVVCVC